MTTAYQVKTPIFEGPLPLLLDLIERRKLSVNQINLAAVTDDFLNHVKTTAELNFRDISQFVLVAATLILIKSKSLLPQLALSEEEESSIKDLEERLRRFQIIKSLMPQLKTQFGKNMIFNRSSAPFIPVFAPDKTITLENILTAAWRVINELPKKEFLPEVKVDKVINLEEIMQSLISRIEKNLRISFKEFTSENFQNRREEKFHVVISFLAMLELIHQGLIKVFQSSHFDEISIEKSAEVKI